MPTPWSRAWPRSPKARALPILHAMMGTLEGKQAWMARMEEAGVPMFDNVEDMAEAAAMLASYRTLRA